MHVWYRLLVLVGTSSLLTGCLDNSKLEGAVAEAESQLEKVKLQLAKEEKKLSESKSAMEAFEAEIAGLKDYNGQLQGYLKKETDAMKAARAADQAVFANREKAKGTFIGEIRTVSGVYGPGKISGFLPEGVLIEQSSGVKQVPYSQLPADLQDLYVLKPYEPSPAPVFVAAVPGASGKTASTAASKRPSSSGPAPATGTETSSGESSLVIPVDIPEEVANLIPAQKISEVSDSYLRNLLVDAEMNVERIRKKKVEVAAMEAKLGGTTNAELTRQKQAQAALQQQDNEMGRQIRELQNEIASLRNSIGNAQSEMANIPSRVSSYSGAIKPSAAQIKAETEKQSKVYRDAIAKANALISDKNSQIQQKKEAQAALESERIAISRSISDLEQVVYKNKSDQVDLDYERKSLQALIENQKALFLQVQARDAEVKKQDALIKDLRK